MGAEHLIFKKESAWGTWTTPDTAIPIEAVTIGSTQPMMSNDDTGAGKGRRPGVRGEVAVAGNLTSKLYAGNGIVQLIASAYGTKAKTGTGPYVNKLLSADDVAFDSFSMQKRYSATNAESFKGLRLGGYKISAKAKQIAMIETRWVGQDSASASSNWADGTAGPAVIASPSYPANIGDPLVFWQGSIKLGGTPSLVTGEVTVAGGTATLGIDNVDIDVDFGLVTDDYQIAVDERTIASLESGKRVAVVKFEPSLSVHEATFFDAWKDGEDAVFEAIFTDGTYGWKWTAPLVRYSAAANPDLNNAYGLKRIPVQGECFQHPTVGVDHGLVLTSAVDLTL